MFTQRYLGGILILLILFSPACTFSQEIITDKENVTTQFYTVPGWVEKEDLLYLIPHVISPASWETEGGSGILKFIQGRLMVKNTEATQTLVAELIKLLNHEPRKLSPTREKIQKALKSPVSQSFNRQSLTLAVEQMVKTFEISIRFDMPTLKEKQIDPEGLLIRQDFKGVSLESTLNILLERWDLAFLVQDDCILITTRHHARNVHTSMRVYDIPCGYNGEEMSEAIRNILSPDTWDKVGYCGPFAGGILILQSQAVHAQVQNMLDLVNGKTRPFTDIETHINETLNKQVSLDFKDISLSEVFTYFQKNYNVQILLNQKLKEVDSDTKISYNCQNISLGNALAVMLCDHNLAWEVHNEVVYVTDPDSLHHTLHAYSLGDEKWDTLEEAISSLIYPHTWDINGGGASLLYRLGDILIVSQPEFIQNHLTLFMKKLITHDNGIPDISNRILQTLAAVKPLDFNKNQLDEVIQILKDTFNIEIHLAYTKLKDAGIDPAAMNIRASFKNKTLASVLDEILTKYDLTWIIQNETLIITPLSFSESSSCYVQIYSIPGIWTEDITHVSYEEQCDSVIEAVIGSISPDSWRENGGYAEYFLLESAQPRMIIFQSYLVHKQIEEFMAALNKIVDENKIKKASNHPERTDLSTVTEIYTFPSCVTFSQRNNFLTTLTDIVASSSWKHHGGAGDYFIHHEQFHVRNTVAVHREISTFLEAFEPSSTPAQFRLHRVMSTVVNLDITQQPLRKTLTELAQTRHFNLQLDVKSLKKAGINPDTATVSVHVQGIKLRSALNLMLRDLGITCAINGDQLWVGVDSCTDILQVRVYHSPTLQIPYPKTPEYEKKSPDKEWEKYIRRFSDVNIWPKNSLRMVCSFGVWHDDSREMNREQFRNISNCSPQFLVRQTPYGHEKVAEFLDSFTLDNRAWTAVQMRRFLAMNTVVEESLKGKTLKELVVLCKNTYNMEIMLDSRIDKKVNNFTIPISGKGMQLGECLKQICAALKIYHGVVDEVVFITDSQHSDILLVNRFYADPGNMLSLQISASQANPSAPSAMDDMMMGVGNNNWMNISEMGTLAGEKSNVQKRTPETENLSGEETSKIIADNVVKKVKEDILIKIQDLNDNPAWITSLITHLENLLHAEEKKKLQEEENHKNQRYLDEYLTSLKKVLYWNIPNPLWEKDCSPQGDSAENADSAVLNPKDGATIEFICGGIYVRQCTPVQDDIKRILPLMKSALNDYDFTTILQADGAISFMNLLDFTVRENASPDAQ